MGILEIVSPGKSDRLMRPLISGEWLLRAWCWFPGRNGAPWGRIREGCWEEEGVVVGCQPSAISDFYSTSKAPRGRWGPTWNRCSVGSRIPDSCSRVLFLRLSCLPAVGVFQGNSEAPGMLTEAVVVFRCCLSLSFLPNSYLSHLLRRLPFTLICLCISFPS